MIGGLEVHVDAPSHFSPPKKVLLQLMPIQAMTWRVILPPLSRNPNKGMKLSKAPGPAGCFVHIPRFYGELTMM